MPYVPLPVRDHVPEPVRALIASVVDPTLKEIRFIMAVKPPADTGPEGILQLSLAKLLLSAVDGAANLFVPGDMGEGDRFRSFMRDNFPWDRVEFGGELAVREWACDFMWDSARCAVIHRYGLHTKGDLRKFGRLFTIGDEALTALELGQEPGKPFFENHPDRTVVWIEPLYWSLRRAIVSALDTPDKAAVVAAYLKSGAWDRKGGKPRSLPS
jgi:hypothetical protein